MRRRVTALLAGAALAAAVAPAAPGSSASPQAAAAPAKVVTLDRGQKVYRGTGDTSLGSLRLRRTARLTWRNPSGGRLRLLTSGARKQQFALLTTTFRTGSVRLRAGTYRDLRVQTRGGWRLTITTLK